MNAPETSMAVARAPLSQFAPSATNRKHTPDHIADLAGSIKQLGVIQPITVRPWPAARGKAPAGVLYEIVIGEGRWLAAREAKLADIPFFWRELTDEQALELQLIENLKRKDLTAVEEARGYQRLMKDHKHTADSIGEKIGKSRGYVYGRLKLLDLCPAALKYFTEGRLDASTALLVARIPDEKLQIQAAKEIAQPGYDEPMSYRYAKDMVRRRFMLKLADAPFPRADAELLASAGTCQVCPKRTGNARDLFADIDSVDVCTDPGCYEAKAAAHVKRQKEAAKKEGIKVIDGAEAKKAMPNSWSGNITGGMVDLDKEIYTGGKATTLRKALGKDMPKPDAVIVDPHHAGRMVSVVATATIKEQLKAKGLDNLLASNARGGKSDAEKEAERKRKQEVAYRLRLFERIRSALTETFAKVSGDGGLLEDQEYTLIAASMFKLSNFDAQKRLARLWIGPDTDKQEDHALVHQFAKRIDTLDRADTCRLLLELSIVGETLSFYGSNEKPEKMLTLAGSLEIDAAAIKATVIAEMREKAKPKAKAKAKTKSEKKVQPQTAKAAAPQLHIGDRVRIAEGIKGPSGHLRKCCGREGTITVKQGSSYCVEFADESGKRAEVSQLKARDLVRLPAAPAPTPSDAAQAVAKDPAPAAPAEAKGTPAKKPKAKADPAPATPANEPPAAAKTTLAQTAWPFPTPKPVTAKATEATPA